MPPLVAIDARDGFASQPRGWGRYARCLVQALRGLAPEDLQLEVISAGGPVPEVVFEQLGLPLLLRRRRTALVHVTNCFLPLVRPCPGVVTIHDLAFEEWRTDFSARTGTKYRMVVPRAARSAQRIICPSKFTRDDLCVRYGVDPEKVRVIPEAPALQLGTLAPPDRRYVLAVGDLRQKKNLTVLVEAFQELWREGHREHGLVLAGADAGQAANLIKLAGTAPVQLTGYVSDERLDALIRGAALLVVPSLYEGFGLVVLEAMTRGTPVLAARAGALPETGGEAAAYFDAQNPRSLPDQLRALLGDPGARERMASQGRQWAAKFSWEGAARQTAAVYRELI